MKDRLNMKIFSAKNNYSFLARFMTTVSESLQKVERTPEHHYEFQAYGSKKNYVKSVLEGHHDKLNFAGILLAYASFEEIFLFDVKDLGKVFDSSLKLSDLSGSFVERCKKYIHKLCKVEPKELIIDWESIADFATIRNFIVHSNGNITHATSREKIKKVINKYDGELALKYDTKLVVYPKYVNRVMILAKDTTVAINEYIGNKL